ncbi:MAG: LamG-like jellyroll fold domain-containing protein, partial [Thermoanaerobaculia bacterium]|nr:LamG-like jellyroll fold domain-containing protein [Thermoanaerobaculia bacterium]
NRIDLRTRATATVLAKNDPRLPAGFGYVYFPMLSRDGHFLAFAASDHRHDHFGADYEVFVVETDPASFEIVGSPVRVTRSPGTDRFPDVHVDPLPLGRHRGETPLRVAVTPPGDAGGEWRWTLNGAARGTAPAFEAVLEQPGSFRLVAERGGPQGGRRLEGWIRVEPPSPPRVLAVDTFDRGREIRISFDEVIRLEEGFAATLESGLRPARHRIDDDRRTLVLHLEEPLAAPDVLHLGGISDTALEPNALAGEVFEVAPPTWPMRSAGLAFLWRSADAANLIYDTSIDAERACTLEPLLRARLDRDFAMELGGGRFAAAKEAMRYTRYAVQTTNEITIELVVTPDREQSGTVTGYGMAAGSRNFVLEQSGDRLVAGLLLAGEERRLEVARLAPGRPTHVVVSYRPGHLRAWADGEPSAESRELVGDFFHWRDRPLAFGDTEWSGNVEAFAIYSRILDDAEVAENHARLAAELRSRPAPERIVVEATAVAWSRPPTLDEISPYREALTVNRYRIDAVEAGTGLAAGRSLRVAEWAILGGEILEPAPAGRRRLVLEPVADNPQLERVVTADTLAGDTSGPLYYLTLTP